MDLPLILVNFKLFESATGQEALILAKLHEKLAKELNVSLAIAVNSLDLALISQEVSIPVFAQHADPVGYGSHTGKISPYQIKDVGAYGVLLNHAENPMDITSMQATIELSKRNNLFTIVCAENLQQATIIKNFNPDMIAIEPPSLIGGDISVSKAAPKIVEEAVEILGDNKVLVGAGISDADDVRIALSLGASGVLVASSVVKADSTEEALRMLISGLSRS